MNRDIDDVARRLEARAFLYGDPGSYREGVRAALQEVAAAGLRPARAQARVRRAGSHDRRRPAAS